jgi:hypothetical protein
MIPGVRGQFINFDFIFVAENNVYDPAILATPVDIYFSVRRGDYNSGPIVDGPFSFLRNNSDISDKVSITRTGRGQYRFRYKIPSSLHEGVYTVFAQTSSNEIPISVSSSFVVKTDAVTLNPIVISNNSTSIVNYKATYEDLNRSNTNTVLLIGHADGIALNDIYKIRSIQSAVDLLGADLGSPLLRGVFDAYAAGARDIFIMAAAPMSEYVDKYEDRLVSSTIFNLNMATPNSITFYQRYYDRLAVTYNILKELDYIDYVVPLEASIIKTGGVDFVTQLASYCADFHNTTGFIQIGIIGSRSGGVKSEDINEIKANSVLVNKLTSYNLNGSILSDNGRFIVPIYGEVVSKHDQLKISYTSTLAASFAGLFAAMPLNMGLIRSRIPGALSVFGSDLTQYELQELDNLGINTVYRGKKTKRSVPYEVYTSNEYTLANKNSTLSKAAQMRLIASLVSRIKSVALEAIGKFGYDRVSDTVYKMLMQMKSNNIIIDYSFNIEVDPSDRGKLVFHISVLSALGLKRINFSLAAGPEA